MVVPNISITSPAQVAFGCRVMWLKCVTVVKAAIMVGAAFGEGSGESFRLAAQTL
jgi:hypothetical protein